MTWRLIPIPMVALLAGCLFWVSSPPDLRRDPITQLVVLWDMPQGTGMVIQTTWSTTNQAELLAFAEAIPTETWQSAMTILKSHPTRILFMTTTGEKWEMHLHAADRLSLFNVTDPGRSGTVDRKGQDIVSLASGAISKSLGHEVDLSTDYSREVYDKHIQRIVPESTKEVQRRYWLRN